MAAPDSRLDVRQHGDILSVTFLDRNILEEARIAEIGDHITRLIDQSNNPKLLLDFSNVEHLSSAALGMLININNRIRAKAGQLRLANIDPQIYEVFTITKLHKLFQIYDEAQEAADSFK